MAIRLDVLRVDKHQQIFVTRSTHSSSPSGWRFTSRQPIRLGATTSAGRAKKDLGRAGKSWVMGLSAKAIKSIHHTNIRSNPMKSFNAIAILAISSTLFISSEAIASQKCRYQTNDLMHMRAFSCKVQRNTNGTAVAVSDLDRGEIYSIGRLGGWGYAGDPNCVVNYERQATVCF